MQPSHVEEQYHIAEVAISAHDWGATILTKVSDGFP
jgi:hypothetical protein